MPRPWVEALVLAVLLLSVALLSAGREWTRPADRAVYDVLLSNFPSQVTDADLPVIINIDEQSRNALGRWPWPRATHAALLHQLADYEVRQVAFDVLFSDPDLDNPTSDAALAAAVADHRGVLLSMVVDGIRGGGALVEVLPLPDLIANAAGVGHVHVEAEDDGIVRGIFLWLGVGEPFWPHLSLALADGDAARPGAYAAEESAPAATGASSRQTHRSDFRLLRFVGPPGAIPRVSYRDVLEGRVPKELLAGRVVFIGQASATSADTLATPMTEAGLPMSGVEFNANAYLALVSDATIRPAAQPWVLLFTLIAGALPWTFLVTRRPRVSLILTLVLVAGVVGTAALLLVLGYWVPPVSAVIAILAGYPLWAWRRLEIALATLGGAVQELQSELEDLSLIQDQPQQDVELAFLSKLIGAQSWRLVTDADQPHSEATLPGSAASTTAIAPVASDDAAARKVRVPLDGVSDQVLELETDRSLSGSERRLIGGLGVRLKDVHRRRESGEPVTRRFERLRANINTQGALFATARNGLDGLRDGVVLVGAFGRVLYANAPARECAALTDSDPADLDVIRFLERVGAVPQGWLHLLRLALVEQQSTSVELTSSNGRELILYLAPGPQSGAILTLVDVTDLKQVERTRRETLAFISHDLRSPVVSMLALIQRFRASEHSPETTQLLTRVEEYARRTISVSQQFLALTRAENEPELARYDLDLVDVVENAIGLVVDVASGQSTEIRLEVISHEDPDDGIWVFGNGELLERLVVNLLSNALNYGGAGNVVTATVQGTLREVTLVVRDCGPGIPADQVDHIFEPYFQVADAQRPAASSVRPRGMGLGLRFVKTVAARHGGDVSVQSRPGCTEFTVTLPAADAAEIER